MNHKATTAGTTRIVFLDYLRVLACLMVIATHSCDSFYIGPGGVWQCASESDRLWISIIDSIMRAAVPLFVMTSSYLLLPLKDDNTTFFKRRFIRVLVPFAVWSCIYAFWPVLMGDLPASELPMRLLHPIWNFNDDSGHLWYIYMLIGLYLFMPVLSPWLKQTGKKAELAFLAVWFVSSFLAYLKEIGAGDMFGECYWNEFHAFGISPVSSAIWYWRITSATICTGMPREASASACSVFWWAMPLPQSRSTTARSPMNSCRKWN